MEIWKDIDGYKGIYQVSNFGRIKSLPKKRKVSGGKYCFKKERILKNSLNSNGYYRVNLSLYGKKECKLIHRLVCISFLKNQENKRTVNHINGIKTDNRVENLEWATDKENIDHSRYILKNNYNDKEIKNKETGEVYPSIRFVMNDTKFSKSHLCAMLKGNYPNKSKFTY